MSAPKKFIILYYNTEYVGFLAFLWRFTLNIFDARLASITLRYADAFYAKFLIGEFRPIDGRCIKTTTGFPVL